ncbi:MAG: DUF1990 family protein [Fimbriimonas sp.]
MSPSIERKFRRIERVPLAWDPVKGGRRGWVCFDDHLEVDLGEDPTGEGFARVADRMISGRYYPADAVVFHGDFQERGALQVGDRVLQRAPMLAFSPIPFVWSAVEIWLAERTADRCRIGYVTTVRHHGRGIWQADLQRENERLKLTVQSTASPNSWLFWLGLPVARFLQLRARRRAIEEFRRLLATAR